MNADIINFTDYVQRYGKVVKLDDGYSTIANPILELLCSGLFTYRQMRVIGIVMRETYGWKARSRRIPLQVIAEKTGMAHRRVSEIILDLIEARVLFREDSQRGPIGINNHIDEWLVDRLIDEVGASSPKKGELDSGEFPQKEGTQVPPVPPKRGNSENPSSPKKRELSSPKKRELAAPTPYMMKTRKTINNQSMTDDWNTKLPRDATPPDLPPQSSSAAISDFDFSVNGFGRDILLAWNATLPHRSIPLTIPPKRRTEIDATMAFVAGCFGSPQWPTDADDLVPWFIDLFNFAQDDDWLRERDFWFFMNPDRLHGTVTGKYHAYNITKGTPL